MKIKNIIEALERLAPHMLQEDYDNAGLIFGDLEKNLDGALICLDITEAIIDEAINNNCQLIISHHPLIFRSIKKLNSKQFPGRILIKAIQEEIAIYCIHTNLDNIRSGVNYILSEKLELENCRILKPQKGLLKKLVTFCPDIHLSDGSYVPDVVRAALFNAGAGYIGNYDSCSFNIHGEGTFRGLEGTDPFIGTKGELTSQKEIRVEIVFPAYNQANILEALLSSHPYEEVAYDIYPLDNVFEGAGSGMIGDLSVPLKEKDFLGFVKDQLGLSLIAHSAFMNKKISRIAICGGAGSFLLQDAIKARADVFLTGDLKYHDFFEPDGKILLADIGHYESEQFTIDLLYEYLIKIFNNFAFQKTKLKTNPINYF
jgi:dinuclear metal center YbgI/SA1388 family protein